MVFFKRLGNSRREKRRFFFKKTATTFIYNSLIYKESNHYKVNPTSEKDKNYRCFRFGDSRQISILLTNHPQILKNFKLINDKEKFIIQIEMLMKYLKVICLQQNPFPWCICCLHAWFKKPSGKLQTSKLFAIILRPRNTSQGKAISKHNTEPDQGFCKMGGCVNMIPWGEGEDVVDVRYLKRGGCAPSATPTLWICQRHKRYNVSRQTSQRNSAVLQTHQADKSLCIISCSKWNPPPTVPAASYDESCPWHDVQLICNSKALSLPPLWVTRVSLKNAANNIDLTGWLLNSVYGNRRRVECLLYWTQAHVYLMHSRQTFICNNFKTQTQVYTTSTAAISR